MTEEEKIIDNMESENLKVKESFNDSYTRGPERNFCNPVNLKGSRENSLLAPFSFKRLMIFIDGGNLFNAIRKEGIKIDYKKMIDFLSRDFDLIRTYYYTGIPTIKSWDQKKETKKEFYNKLNKQIKFLEDLELNYNFHVITKPLYMNNKKPIEKGVDVNIASDIIWHGLSNNYDSFILISGDKDLMDCLYRMKDNGKRVIVANFENRVSREIRKIVDKYINLSKHIEEIRR